MTPSNRAVYWGAMLSFYMNFAFWILVLMRAVCLIVATITPFPTIKRMVILRTQRFVSDYIICGKFLFTTIVYLVDETRVVAFEASVS